MFKYSHNLKTDKLFYKLSTLSDPVSANKESVVFIFIHLHFKILIMFFKTKVFPHIPNFITMLNLVSGAIGIVFIFQGHLMHASIMIYIAGIFDFFDGFAARLLKVTSDIGKSLDSLADVVSFGLLPTGIIYQLLFQIIQQSNPAFSLENANYLEIGILSSSLLVAVFSALRLAKFNHDSRQSEGFIGIPTPANALLISSFPFITMHTESIGAKLLMNLYVLIPITVILSLLLTSEIPMLSLKFKSFALRKNIFRYLLIVTSIILVTIWGIASIPFIFLFYIMFSLIRNYTLPES